MPQPFTMSRRAIAKGTLVTLLIAGVIILVLQIAGIVAENVAEGKTIAAIQKLGGRVVHHWENKPDLNKWIDWAWPASSTVQELTFFRTQVTDTGLKELAGFKSLQILDLSGTQVTDAGLKELAGLKSLQVLDLSDTQVTDLGVAELGKALPKCDIFHPHQK